MKRLVLLFAGMLVITTAFAKEQNHQNPEYTLNNYRYAQPITFMERGVEFLIFPDGSFDFNTHALNRYYNDGYYNNNSRRGSINAEYHGPNVSLQFTSNNNYRNYRGVQIIRDTYGKVRRIGDVLINYDRYGNITQAGSVFIQYGRGKNATVTQVGGLRVNYNHWGEIVSTKGYVNWDNRNVHYDLNCHDERDNHHYYNDDQYFYYKKDGEIKKQKKNKR